MDAFVDAEMAGDGLQAWSWSWSCFRLLLDPADGRVIGQVFTK
jgi:hypothetical protein